MTGTVNVTSANTDGVIGDLVIKTGSAYTSETNYYTLVFSEDMTLDETVGVELNPSIEYVFSNFYAPEEGYAYYISFETQYSYDSLYAEYVDIADATAKNDNIGVLTRSSTSSTSTNWSDTWTGTVNELAATLTLDASQYSITYDSRTYYVNRYSYVCADAGISFSGYICNANYDTIKGASGYYGTVDGYYTTNSTTNMQEFYITKTASDGSIYTFYIHFDSTNNSEIRMSYSVSNTTLSQTSTKTKIDLSGTNTQRMTEEGYTDRYTTTQTFAPGFKWRHGMKPTTTTGYNSFLSEVEKARAAGQTFTIILTISYEKEDTSSTSSTTTTE